MHRAIIPTIDEELEDFEEQEREVARFLQQQDDEVQPDENLLLTPNRKEDPHLSSTKSLHNRQSTLVGLSSLDSRIRGEFRIYVKARSIVRDENRPKTPKILINRIQPQARVMGSSHSSSIRPILHHLSPLLSRHRATVLQE